MRRRPCRVGALLRRRKLCSILRGSLEIDTLGRQAGSIRCNLRGLSTNREIRLMPFQLSSDNPFHRLAAGVGSLPGAASWNGTNRPARCFLLSLRRAERGPRLNPSPSFSPSTRNARTRFSDSSPESIVWLGVQFFRDVACRSASVRLTAVHGNEANWVLPATRQPG